MASPETIETWPALNYRSWAETGRALHLWTQIVGKVRMAKTPWLNHSWHVTLYVTARGLTTGPIPFGPRCLELEFDLVEHKLRVRTDGPAADLPLGPMSVAAFYARLMQTLEALGTPVTINPMPNEMADAAPFTEDVVTRPYDAGQVEQVHRALLQADRVLKLFRTGFLGKASPVHLFWGGFDLAVTRFSGRRAPLHPGGIPNMPDTVTREAYSHEVSSCGFWLGGPGMEEAVFYAYAYPEPHGFREAPLAPAEARYDAAFGEYVLPYAVVRAAPDPDAALLAFLTSTYEAAANAGGWDRAALECALGQPCRPRPI